MNNTSIMSEINEDEAKRYDRQIRLWGVKSQKMLRKANVLCIGLSGLASEVIKNIVLAGINCLTIIDDAKVNEKDCFSHIFTHNKIGLNRAEVAAENITLLNPMVMIRTLDWNPKNKIENKDEDFLNLLKNSTAVFISNYDPETMMELNDLCHSFEGSSINFFAACDWGYYGFSFTDLGRSYKYISEEVDHKEICAEGPAEKKIHKEPQKTYIEKYLEFTPLRQALAIKSGKAGIGITKRTSPVLVLVHILFKFHKIKDRYPDSQFKEEDSELLNRLKEEVSDDLNYSKSSLKLLEDDKFYRHVYGELSPVSAIIGGTLGQDIIRSITHQDAPIRNFFLFNGLRLSGTVESIGK